MNIFKKQYDLIAIGDTVVDAFIKLKDAHINCKINSSDCEICMKFGDKIPFEFAEVCYGVGNSANAAVSTSRLGLKTAIITNIGADNDGQKVLENFKKEKVATEFIKKHSGIKTNYHYVLWFGAERTILIKHEKYGYKIPELTNPKWLYLSSLGEDSLEFHNEISLYLEKNPETKLVFQPGTFQIKFGREKLKDIYKRTEIFFCNKEEAQIILNTKEHNIKTLMQELQKIGPRIVVLTDGPNGAYVYDSEKAYFMPPYPDPKPPYERTGAGDAYASTFTSAIILGKTIGEALKWAGVNSMAVVQEIGAQKGLLTQNGIKKYLDKAPENYKMKEI